MLPSVGSKPLQMTQNFGMLTAERLDVSENCATRTRRRWRGLVESGGLEKCGAETRLMPNRCDNFRNPLKIKGFELELAGDELSLQLEKPGRFFRAAILCGVFFRGFFAASGRVFFAAVVFSGRLFLKNTGVNGSKQRDGSLSHAIAINFVDAHADRRDQEGQEPKPCDVFFCCGHFAWESGAKVWWNACLSIGKMFWFGLPLTFSLTTWPAFLPCHAKTDCFHE